MSGAMYVLLEAERSHPDRRTTMELIRTPVFLLSLLAVLMKGTLTLAPLLVTSTGNPKVWLALTYVLFPATVGFIAGHRASRAYRWALLCPAVTIAVGVGIGAWDPESGLLGFWFMLVGLAAAADFVSGFIGVAIGKAV